MNQLPIVLTFTPHDPSGISSLQGDIETLSSLGCHCTSALTGVFAKDSREVKWLHNIPASTLIAQARAILEDMPVDVIKIGDLCTVENIEAVHSILMDYPHIPVVFDPTCYLNFSEQNGKAKAYNSLIIPYCKIVLVNPTELNTFIPFADSEDSAVNLMLESDCDFILTTRFSKKDKSIHNQLHSISGCLKEYTNLKLDRNFQGAGAVLSAAIAGYMAHGAEMCEAVGDGHRFLQRSLRNPLSMGMGDEFPYRLAGLAS